ncbi:hypothetical protein HNV12_02095 [Methanococcoides sp. SA1]|nr:hypothetical protein [Methanococcoides sp. SA1]
MKNNESRRTAIIFITLGILIASLIVLLSLITPEQIVQKIGIKNAYFLAFLTSFFGGFSALGSVSFISVLATLSAGGINPIYLGLIAGVSLATGDLIMFYFGSKGRELIKGKWDKKINRFTNHLKQKRWLRKSLPFLAYTYLAFTPLPNDILILSLAAAKYPTKKTATIAFLGDITFALIITILSSKGIMLFT